MADAIAKYLGLPREPAVVYDPLSREPIGDEVVRAWRDPKSRRRGVRTFFRKYQSLDYFRQLVEAGEGPCPCCGRWREVPADIS